MLLPQIKMCLYINFYDLIGQQNANYHRHTDYYRKHYQENRKRLLEMGIIYRSSRRVKKLREGYKERYRPIERERSRRRREDPVYRKFSHARAKSRSALLAIAPKICCHCSSKKRIHCHHLGDNPLNWKIQNLCWLCTVCHRAVHSTFRLAMRRQILRSIQKFLRQHPTSS